MDAARDERWIALLGGDAVAKRILEIPEVDAATTSGDPWRVRDALRSALSRSPGEDQAQRIESALALRRNFVRPAAAPSMYTLNGIGTRLSGRSEVADDGTYVATLYATVIFVPVLPLRSYLVAPATANSWHFLGKVPRSGREKAWRWGALTAVVLLGAALALGLFRSNHSDVRFVNGLDTEVVVTLDGHTIRLGPGRMKAQEVKAGRHHLLAVSSKGEPVEELDVEVPRGGSLVAYSVLGAAPVILQELVYTTGTPEPNRLVADFAGQRWIVRDGVDHVFQLPPEQIRMSGKRETRLHAYLPEGGWRAAAALLVARGEREQAAEITERIALLQGDEPSIRFAAGCARASGGPRELLRFSELALARNSDSIEAHRASQTALIDLGRRGEAQQRYRAPYEADKTSARAGYLYARTLPAHESIRVLEPLAQLHPEDKWLRRALAWDLFQECRFEESLPHFEKLRTLDPEDAAVTLSQDVRALVASRRVEDARKLLLPLAESGNVEAEVLYAKVIAFRGSAAGTSSLSAVLSKTLIPAEVDRVLAELAARVRDGGDFEIRQKAIEDADTRATCRLEIRSATDPAGAADDAERASDAALAGLDTESRLAIACALLRRKAEAPTRRLYPQTADWELYEPWLRSPGDHLEDHEIDLDLRAVLAAAAADRETDPEERERLRMLGRKFDVFKILVR